MDLQPEGTLEHIPGCIHVPVLRVPAVRTYVCPHAEILQGHPADKIAEESAGHDLCVCGSLGRTNAKRAVIGSVAEKVVRLAYCPVLVCRKNQE